MVFRRKRFITNVSSLLIVIPNSLLTGYTSTKARILKFSSINTHQLKMSSRHLPNPYKDYSEGKQCSIININGNDISDEFREKLSSGTKVLLKRLEDNKRQWYSLEDTSLYTGLPGVAYTFYHYGKYFEDQSYISRSTELVGKCIEKLRGKRHVTFLTGNAGPLALGAVMNHFLGEKEESKNMISKLKYLSSYAIYEDGSGLPDEILYGRAGYLYALLFVNKHMTPPPIEDDLIRQVINYILSSGKSYAKAHGIESPLMYMWHDSEYLGGAHGLAGILYLLLQAREFLTEDQLKTEVEPSIQWLENLKYPSGNFPSSVGSTTDKLVHWCHGAPSMTMLFCLAYEIFKKDQYLNTALKCGEVIWERGLLKKGCGICHGVAGNAYSFLSLYQLTKDPKHLYRACKFTEWCLDYDAHQTRPADRPFSLFEGLAGTIYFLVDMQKPSEAKFPGYTL
ncbi:glutathione S-transferase LANCL1 isoform X1 [Nasonia vitripennis]|uniref:LanC-like protein 2 n=2 Tax=Nasonia vitripennis TaxID=7425 RepID=A0A7M7QI49_NASVI|nr:glutathione S-transferase LANCL1 isoform X1 [Nasonia vitripennis]